MVGLLLFIFVSSAMLRSIFGASVESEEKYPHTTPNFPLNRNNREWQGTIHTNGDEIQPLPSTPDGHEAKYQVKPKQKLVP